MAVLSNNDLTFANGGGVGLYYKVNSSDHPTIMGHIMDNAPTGGFISGIADANGNHCFMGQIYPGRQYGVLIMFDLWDNVFLYCRNNGVNTYRYLQ